MKFGLSRFRLLLAGISVFVIVAVVNAIPSDLWQVYLYDSDASSLIAVNSDGTTDTFNIEMGDYLDGTSLRFSPDGHLVAACNAYDPSVSTTMLYIRDIQAETNLLRKSFEPASYCAVGSFKADGSELTLGLGYADWDNADNEYPRWRLLVLDVATGEILDEFNSEMPHAPDLFAEIYQAAPYYFNPEASVLVQGLAFDGERILFKAIPIIPDGTFSQPAFFWNRQDDSVTEWHEAGHNGSDFLLASGEIVFIDYDETLPRGAEFGMNESANVVKIRDENGTRIILHDSEWILLDASFVNGGTQIAVSMILASSPDGNYYQRYEFINRDGSHYSITEPDAEGGETNRFLEGFMIRGIADGTLIYRNNQFENIVFDVPYELGLDFYDGVSRTSFWEDITAINEDPHYYQLVWASPMRVQADLAPFPAISE